MKFRSTTRVYRIDNKESHHTTIQILGFFLPLLHRFEEHDRTSANSPYTVPFFTGLRMLVAFLTPGCLSHLSSATVEGLRNISGCHCPQSSGILKVLIRIYTTPADQRGGMFQNLLYLTIWNDETNKMFAAQKNEKIAKFLRTVNVICTSFTLRIW